MKEIITNKDMMEMCYLTRNPLCSKKKVRLLQKEITWELVHILNLSRTGRRLILQHVIFITSSWFLHFTCNMIHSFVLHCRKWIFVVLETLILEVYDSLFLCHIVLLLKKKKRWKTPFTRNFWHTPCLEFRFLYYYHGIKSCCPYSVKTVADFSKALPN